MKTLWDDTDARDSLGYRVVEKGGAFPFVVMAYNAPVAAFVRDHAAIEYAQWPSKLLEITRNTAESIIAECRKLPHADGRNTLMRLADQLHAEAAAWDDEPEGKSEVLICNLREA